MPIQKTIRGTSKKKKRQHTSKRKLSFVKKHEYNPILTSNSEHYWELSQTFNPSSILLGDKIHFLYRAVGADGISRLGYAVSNDGVTIEDRQLHPVYEHGSNRYLLSSISYPSGGSSGGAEDPRIVRVGKENKLYMTYTACDDSGLRVGLTSISLDDFLCKDWKWNAPALISPVGEVHKNWVLFPEKIGGQYAILHSIRPKIAIAYVDSLESLLPIESSYSAVPELHTWEKRIRGAGPPPIKTKGGWLLFYHAMDSDTGKYKVGAMLLDLLDPTIIRHRSRGPVLEPDQSYENNGFKGGVVYVSGAVVKDGTIFLYYGGADSCVCVAYSNLESFLEKLIEGKGPKLKKLKRKL
ncbi:MAG: hypothetical protein KGI50_00135 [Patescibacteria group bacterium]|nr:hypothetical protein [Patescibacteria group bacterium]MDE2438230.1 hypothetical protein [Patescibacteria group bacterium]